MVVAACMLIIIDRSFLVSLTSPLCCEIDIDLVSMKVYISLGSTGFHFDMDLQWPTRLQIAYASTAVAY